jgi:hypothetical protein
MWRVYVGAVAVIAGIAAFIEAHGHVPRAIERYGHLLPGNESKAADRLDACLTGAVALWPRTTAARTAATSRKGAALQGQDALGVRPEEVVQLVEASDGRLVAEGAVGSSAIVEVDPAG